VGDVEWPPVAAPQLVQAGVERVPSRRLVDAAEHVDLAQPDVLVPPELQLEVGDRLLQRPERAEVMLGERAEQVGVGDPRQAAAERVADSDERLHRRPWPP
jgi:hypothetical protein